MKLRGMGDSAKLLAIAEAENAEHRVGRYSIMNREQEAAERRWEPIDVVTDGLRDGGAPSREQLLGAPLPESAQSPESSSRNTSIGNASSENTSMQRASAAK